MPYQIPIGPLHPALEEPYKLSFQCVADTVDKVNVEVGFSFRGIEILAQKREWTAAITLVERVCGICSNVHAMSLCMTAERIAEIEVPRRAQYIRTILAELERLHSHFLWAGLAAEFMGYETAFMEVFHLRETVMDILESISGNRVNYGMNRIGGVNHDISDPLRYVSTLEEVAKKIEAVIVPTFLDNPTARKRMSGVGVLTKEDAIAWGTVGPVARASGLAIDVRSDMPYLAYADLGFQMITQDDGDVQARVVVRALELLESLRLAIQALKELPSGPIRAFEGLPVIPAGEATNCCEAPRGEVFYYVASDGGDKPARVRVRTPSFVNIPALEAMMPGQEFANTSLIQASVDPCISCTDR